ncbi:NAD(P)H-dependent oxidoreductase [Kordiimonas lacus]|uniref:Glutathione-regulated potassium-efflux system ancillary protein KefF n=1 Tax=Kordiimonas lacus TaxID=637679 RepID=A0A1G6UEY3_9PROT|nr:NAD(P)H-dependent oxidoreductase [Kordiimonas lacus]SDD39266.1 glutathione-regulated potassium-efflux system ancillary protein KefF [Kordiimonas lacus]
MSRALVLFAHPNPQRSRLNRHLILAARQVPEVAVHDLYEMYPDMHINVAHEQEALVQADLVVFQFPIYWFSAPAILKEWQDSVLTKGFAFGAGGTALKGKHFMLAVTTGGDAASYAETRPHGAPMSAYLRPFEQTASFCGMRLVTPYICHGVGQITPADIKGEAERFTAAIRRRVMEKAA